MDFIQGVGIASSFFGGGGGGGGYADSSTAISGGRTGIFQVGDGNYAYQTDGAPAPSPNNSPAPSPIAQAIGNLDIKTVAIAGVVLISLTFIGYKIAFGGKN